MRGRTWVYTPHLGGRTIPAAVRERTERRIVEHGHRHFAGRYTRLGVRFKGALCYIDAFIEPELPARRQLHGLGDTREQYLERLRDVPIHLCRLRYFGNEDAWTLAFFTYSNERYSACVFPNGSDHGTPEEALDIGAVYLPEPRCEVAKRGRSRPTKGWSGRGRHK
jgi:hypothetical protein